MLKSLEVLVSKSFLIRRKSHWLSKGYIVEDLCKDISKEQYNTSLVPVKIEDLEKGSSIRIEYYCDYCKDTTKTLSTDYQTYNFRRKKLAKDCCTQCASTKAKEVALVSLSDEDLIEKSILHGKHISESRHARSNDKKELEKVRRKETVFKNHGVENVFQSTLVKDKIINTIFKRYGVCNVSQAEEIKDIKKDTSLEHFNAPHFRQREDAKKYTYQRMITFSSEKQTTLITTEEQYMNLSLNNFKLKLSCNRCNLDFEKQINTSLYPSLFKCPECSKLSGTSVGEQELFTFIKQYYHKSLERNNRTILNKKEIDIYLPNEKFGLEYDGVLWHSELYGNKDKEYHINKQLLAKEKGIVLYFIYDYEWTNHRPIIESIIKNKLGIVENRYYARKCEIRLVEYKTAKHFYNITHIQGGDIINSKMISIGLYYCDELVSLVSFDKPRFNKSYDYELIRFSNKLNTQVVGGFSKLLKYFERNYLPKSILTYSESRLFQSNTYENAGFKYLYNTEPGYFYIKNGIPVGSRYKFQKHKLEKLLPIFDKKLTEWENMIINGYDRVWDCGNRTFVKEYN